MAVGKSSALRMSGLNSGLDTEAIVNAMSASTKLRITTNQRKVLKLEAQQEAYRGVIDKLTEFKKKYFDSLNRDKYMLSSSTFNKYTSTISQDGVDTKISGVSVTSNSNAKPGTYSVELKSAATQTKYTTQSLNARQGFNANDYVSAGGETQYSMSVTVGSKTENITFGGSTKEEVIDSINEQLLAFGKTNDNKGIISLKETVEADTESGIEGSGVFIFNATDKSKITTSKIAELKESVTFSPSFETGNNSVSIIIDGEAKSISFSTIESSYFDEIFPKKDGAGNIIEKVGANGFVYGADEEKVAQFLSIAKDMYNTQRHNAYEQYKTDNGFVENPKKYEEMSDAQKALFDAEVARRDEARRESVFTDAVLKEYEIYRKAEIAAGNTPDGFNDFSEQYNIDNNFKVDDPVFGKYYKDYEDGKIDPEMFFPNYNEEDSFNKNIYEGIVAEKDFMDAAPTSITADMAVRVFNENSIKLNLEDLKFSDGTKLEVNFTNNGNEITGIEVKAYTLNAEKEKIYKDLAMQSNSGVSDFELETSKITESTVSNSTKISELGLEADEQGNYSFKINGESFSFTGDISIKDMMAKVNANNKAGVTMTYSSLKNTFELTSTQYGANSDIELEDGQSGLLSTLGFNSTVTKVHGKNLILTLNGEEIESASNSYQIDGTTFTFSSQAAAGTKFDVTVELDTTKAKEMIKEFIKDYNDIISYVYGMVDEKPKKDYYFLTDDDKEEMALSDKQEEQWEIAAKKGILYNDSTIRDVMSRFRTALIGGVTGSDGSMFGLYSLGITTSSDYEEHGKLVISDENKFDAAFANNFQDIVKLFSDSTDGIMTKFSKEMEYAVKSTGVRQDKGILLQKAGTAKSSDNAIYDQIKSLNTLIASLESRYEKQQDRYWKIFSALETQMGTLNSQQSSISQLLGM